MIAGASGCETEPAHRAGPCFQGDTETHARTSSAVELRGDPERKSFDIKELRFVLNIARRGGPVEFQEQHNASVVAYAV